MELTKNEKIMRITGLIYAVLFLGTALVFILLPGNLFDVINSVSASLFPPLPQAGDTGKFWLSLTVSMMATITVLSLFIFINVKKYYMMAIPLAVAKFTSSIMGLIFFLIGFARLDTGWNTLANCVIAITDLPLGILILILFIRVKREQK